MFKIVVITLLVLVVGSLFYALVCLVRDRGRGERAARALTLRISLSMLLFAILMGGYYLSFIQPH